MVYLPGPGLVLAYRSDHIQPGLSQAPTSQSTHAKPRLTPRITILHGVIGALGEMLMGLPHIFNVPATLQHLHQRPSREQRL